MPFKKNIPEYLNIKTKRIRDDYPEDNFHHDSMAALSNRIGVFLLSGSDSDCSRYSMLAGDPFMLFSSKGDHVHIETAKGTLSLKGNPFDILNEIFGYIKDNSEPVIPFSSGAAGYIAYEAGRLLENSEFEDKDDLHLPDIFLIFPASINIYDRIERRLTEIKIDTAPKICCPNTGIPDALDFLNISKPRGNTDEGSYKEAVQRVKEYIRQGDIYQANISQRFSSDYYGNPSLFWKSMFEKNPAPFYAYINAGDHQILSTSMERFIFRCGSYIETRPIKGTAKRGETEEEDLKNLHDLETSGKEDAELSMIVDLMRNDIGKVCKYGSVKVAEHKRVEKYSNVFQMVSKVQGVLNDGMSNIKILKAVFPGGSITGCPKIRAMEIINELEPVNRHVYTGSIGYIGLHENMDMNIAIRTAICTSGKCHFYVGSGIVHDSDSKAEFEETISKAKTYLEIADEFGINKDG